MTIFVFLILEMVRNELNRPRHTFKTNLIYTTVVYITIALIIICKPKFADFAQNDSTSETGEKVSLFFRPILSSYTDQILFEMPY